MKKQSRQLAILLLMLAVLAIAFFGIRQYNKSQSEKAAADKAEKIVDINKNDIIRFTYDYEGETYTFEKTEDIWRYTGNPDWDMHQNRILAMTNRLAQMEINQTIENVTDLSQYGLSEGYRVFTFETAAESYTFHIGSFNDVTAAYYICRPSESTVYAVPTPLVTSFNRTPEELLAQTDQ